MNLEFSFSDILLFLESLGDFSAAGADELPSFLLGQCAKVMCAPLSCSSGLSQPKICVIIGKEHTLLPYINLVLLMILLTTISLISSLNFSYFLKDFCSIFFCLKIRQQTKREQQGFVKSHCTISLMKMYLDSVYSLVIPTFCHFYLF